MRSVSRVFLIMLLMASLSMASSVHSQQAGGSAGQPAQPMAQPSPAEQWLDYTLNNWEKVMSNVTSFQLKLTRAKLDKTFNTTEIMEGVAVYQKGAKPKDGSKARLEMAMKGKPHIYERYICTGTFLYQYEPASKTIRVHDLPPPKQGNIGDDNFLQFIFGMKADQAKLRYAMTYVPAPPPQDKHYHYIQIAPKASQDKAEFSEARLVLMRESFMPRQLWYKQPNGDEYTWDFPEVKTGIDIPLNWFTPPEEKGWKTERVPRAVPVSNPKAK